VRRREWEQRVLAESPELTLEQSNHGAASASREIDQGGNFFIEPVPALVYVREIHPLFAA
jgi:hypothetical protein